MNGDGETFSVEFADTKEAMFDAINVEDVRQGDFCKFARCDLNVLCDFPLPRILSWVVPSPRVTVRSSVNDW